MAYISTQEMQVKKQALKALNQKYKHLGMKASLSTNKRRSTVYCTVQQGKLDFIANFNECTKDRDITPRTADDCLEVNPYHYNKHFSAECLQYLDEVHALLKDGHWDESDIMTDYFNCAWYYSVEIGKWDKPYNLIK